jgi:hypothetical protein
LLTAFVALIAVQGIRGGIADRLVPWVTVIGLVSVASLAAVACMWFGERVPVVARIGRRWVVSAATIVLLTGSVLDGINRLESTRRMGTPAENLYTDTHALMAAAGVRKPRIESRGDAWAEMAGIVVQFRKRSIPVAVSANSVWMFGAPLAPSGDEDAELIIADAPSRALLSRRVGDCLWIERGGISVHALLSSLKKPTAVQACE